VDGKEWNGSDDGGRTWCDCRRVHAGNVDARLEVSRARKEGTCENPASKGTAMSARQHPTHDRVPIETEELMFGSAKKRLSVKVSRRCRAFFFQRQ
jgi:hypothetical protein